MHTTREVAAALGVCRYHVAWMARRYGVGRKHGRAWAFTDADLAKLRQRPPRGRPRSGGSLAPLELEPATGPPRASQTVLELDGD